MVLNPIPWDWGVQVQLHAEDTDPSGLKRKWVNGPRREQQPAGACAGPRVPEAIALAQVVSLEPSLLSAENSKVTEPPNRLCPAPGELPQPPVCPARSRAILPGTARRRAPQSALRHVLGHKPSPSAAQPGRTKCSPIMRTSLSLPVGLKSQSVQGEEEAAPGGLESGSGASARGNLCCPPTATPPQPPPLPAPCQTPREAERQAGRPWGSRRADEVWVLSDRDQKHRSHHTGPSVSHNETHLSWPSGGRAVTKPWPSDRAGQETTHGCCSLSLPKCRPPL